MTENTITLAERYVLGSLIARGGMAEVWTARDEVLARTVAVKLLHVHLAADPSFVARFRAEALAAARLTHPNIVAIYDTGTGGSGVEERHFIVMEHCPKGTLHELLQRDGVLQPERVAAIGTTICDALSYAHSHGVIHRDVKPANVLLSEHGTLKVGDFGIAKAAFGAQDLTSTGAIIGSVAYISPEQAQGEEPDARSDLYALGILLYELLCGRPPFKAETDVATALSHVRDRPEPMRSLRAGVPRQLEEVVQKTLEKDPDRRYSSAEEMRHELARVSGEPSPHFGAPLPVHDREPTPQPSADSSETHEFLRTEGRRIAPVILLIAAAIVAAIVIASLVRVVEPGGNNGERGGGGNGSGGSKIEIQSAQDFDPEGDDGSEHPDEVPLAYDGQPGTAWQTSNYTSTLEAQNKGGVGIVFDLGEAAEVGEVTVDFDAPGYGVELRAADSEGASADDFEVIDSTDSSDAAHVFQADGQEARYWLVWITALQGGTGRGVIAEVSFVGG
jgi:serine/threonine protein kinase